MQRTSEIWAFSKEQPVWVNYTDHAAEVARLVKALRGVGMITGDTYCWCKENARDCDNAPCEEARTVLAAYEQAKAEEQPICAWCGPDCQHGAEHNARIEGSAKR